MIDLSPHHLETVKRILDEHVPGCEVKAFGSRATWTATDYSDLDLLVLGQSEVAGATLSRLNEAFEESDLPMRVDVVDWHGTSPAFRKLIEPSCVRLPMAAGADWSQTAFGDCALLVGDKVDPASCGDMPYIGLEHIGQGTLSLLGNGTAADVESTKTVFRAGDILFGKLRPYFRKVVRPDFDGICSTDIWVVRPKAGVDASFLFYLMASDAFVDFASQGSEGTRMPRAKWEHVVHRTVYLPSLAEQRAIANVLGTLDDKIELNRRMTEALESAVGTLFKYWFAVSDDANQQTARLGDLFHLNPMRPLMRGKMAPYLEMANMPTRTHSPRSVTCRSYGSGMRFRNGDTLIARITPCLENGKVAYVDFLEEGEVGWGSTEFIVMCPRDPVPREFAYFLAREQRFRDFAIKNMGGSSGRQRVSAKALSEFAIAAPDESRCRQFGDFAAPLMAQSGMFNRESRSLAVLRDRLLPNLISGEIRVRDAEDLAEAAT